MMIHCGFYVLTLVDTRSVFNTRYFTPNDILYSFTMQAVHYSCTDDKQSVQAIRYCSMK